MKIVKDKISREELKQMAKNGFGDFVKIVVDINNEIMVVDSELHADGEALLLQHGSNHEYLWGINFYPESLLHEQFIVFNSMINFRPEQGNNDSYIHDQKIREKIITIVNKLIQT